MNGICMNHDHRIALIHSQGMDSITGGLQTCKSEYHGEHGHPSASGCCGRIWLGRAYVYECNAIALFASKPAFTESFNPPFQQSPVCKAQGDKHDTVKLPCRDDHKHINFSTLFFILPDLKKGF